LNAILALVLIVMSVLLAIPLFVGSFFIGWYTFPDLQPTSLMLVWDAGVVAFLFFWLIGLMNELQRAEGLSLSKFLHLPVSVTSAFIINYISSLMSASIVVFVPLFLGCGLALILARGPSMAIVLALTAAFLLMITALTYQFQGWLASLMTNPRRRRTVI